MILHTPLNAACDNSFAIFGQICAAVQARVMSSISQLSSLDQTDQQALKFAQIRQLHEMQLTVWLQKAGVSAWAPALTVQLPFQPMPYTGSNSF